MPWVKLDDQFTDHPKIERLTDRAFRLHVAGLCFCGRMLTDGFVPDDRVRRLLPTVTKKTVAELEEQGLWKREDGGFRIHGFLDYNPSRAKVLEDREAAAERQRKRRMSHRDSRRESHPPRPDPSRPEGSRDGVSEEPSVRMSSPAPSGGDDHDTSLPADVVERNVMSIREAKNRLRGVAS